LHELEVALDYRDQVDLRQARKHAIAQALRALGPEVGDLLDRAGRLARRSAVALGGAGHMYVLLRSNRIQYFRIRCANYIKQCVLCQAFLVEHDERGRRPSLMLVSRQRIPSHTATPWADSSASGSWRMSLVMAGPSGSGRAVGGAVARGRDEDGGVARRWGIAGRARSAVRRGRRTAGQAM